ncbi:endolytic transglycosylase MltG [Salinispirillum sp. LH 10-3-1]|uniref:Endolytic murein transglycosylase n=1 Tax=Salinispirillum sp. LH 10-3-1 TaxID=2952525 RepID=A0AB38YCA3_9GAMM
MKTLKRWFAIGTVLLTVVIAGGSGWLYSIYKSPTLNADTVVFEVQRGSSVRAVANQLAAEGVWADADFLYYYARLSQQTALRAGEYEVPPSISLPDLLALLQSGRTVQYQVTFIEGWRFRDWREALAQLDNIQHTIMELSEEEVAQVLELDYVLPEGLLYPDTYSYQRGATDVSILRQARDKMVRVLAEEWENRSDKAVVKTPYEALILASIVEKETGASWERGEIAGVFTRRTNLGMRLETDPTVIYGLGDEFRGNLTRRHLNTTTPYNTYRVSGFPPTPIAMPGTDSIRAALNPEPGTSLFFVARGDGTHQFSDNYSDHLAAVRRYQLRRASDYRSTPPPAPPESTE